MFALVDSVLYARMNKHKGLSGYTAQILSLNIEYKSVSHLFNIYRVSQILFSEVASHACQQPEINLITYIRLKILTKYFDVISIISIRNSISNMTQNYFFKYD